MCKFYKITEYFFWIIGCFLISSLCLNWIQCGNLLEAIGGMGIICVLAGISVLYTIREILYWASDRTKKDGQ